jgi:hypothetical protein
MSKLECPLADSLIRPISQEPVLSIVIAPHHRAAELQLTVQTIADQLHDGLEDKVELLISDNASGSETVDVIRALAEHYPRLGYTLNARDEGGFFNFFAAPWRARGRYTWVFGSDHVLLDGGVASVVSILEREAPSFLTLNKRAANADLTKALYTSLNTVPDRRFDSFIDLFRAFGVNQLAFISAQIESTEAARKLDPEPYLRTDSGHPHVAAYLEKHAFAPSCYSAANHLVHRVETSPMLDYEAGNVFDYGATFPRLLIEICEKVGAPKDLFERTSGHRKATSYDPPEVTFVDAIFENILRGMSAGQYLNVGHQRALESMLVHCRPDRMAQFAQLWTYSQRLITLERNVKAAQGSLDFAQKTALETSRMFTQSTLS